MVGGSDQWSLYLRILEKGLLLKTITLLTFLVVGKVFVVNLLFVVGKSFGKLTERNVVFFLISSIILGLFDQLQIFSQLYVAGLLWFLIGIGLLEL